MKTIEEFIDAVEINNGVNADSLIKDSLYCHSANKRIFNNTVLNGNNIIRIPISEPLEKTTDILDLAQATNPKYEQYMYLHDKTIRIIQFITENKNYYIPNEKGEEFASIINFTARDIVYFTLGPAFFYELFPAESCDFFKSIPKEMKTGTQPRKITKDLSKLLNGGLLPTLKENTTLQQEFTKYYNYVTHLIDVMQYTSAKHYDIIISTQFEHILWSGEFGNGMSTCISPQRFNFVHAIYAARMENLGAAFLVPRGGEPENAICRTFILLDDNHIPCITTLYPKKYSFFQESLTNFFINQKLWNKEHSTQPAFPSGDSEMVDFFFSELGTSIIAGVQEKLSFEEIKSFYTHCKECGGVEDVLYTTSGRCGYCEEEDF